MKPAFPPSADHGDWKTLYRAAIFEKNRTIVPERISEAERAVLARGRELFYCGGSREERNALDSALHALHALRGFKGAAEHVEAEIASPTLKAAA